MPSRRQMATRAGIARGEAFHFGADQRGFPADQRHGLALHVQDPSGRGWRRRFSRKGIKLAQRIRPISARNVNVVHFLAALQDEVSGLPAVDQFGGNALFLIERGVGLRDT